VIRGAARPDLSKVHVLVVDDEADAREMMSSALELCGATVTTAQSAREALATLTSLASRAMPIHVVLSDLAMPEQDGYALIQEIRTHPDSVIAHLPAAAVTACAREDERQRALAAGFHLHVAKPVVPGALFDAVVRLAGMIPANA
jgi:CheY-like chemotaxis protein